MPDLDVNPLAAAWPMLPPDELQELADDIRANGLLNPITLDSAGRILEGRNRYAACMVAGVEPAFTTYDGDDELGYILSMNERRRHLTKGQRAMVIAKMLASGGLPQTGIRDTAKRAGMSHSRIADASTVLKWAPALVEGVVSGSMTLDAAVEDARNAKREADSDEAKMTKLRTSAPDLATQVEEGTLTLNEAFAAEVVRREEREQHIRLKTEALTRDYQLLPTGGDLAKLVEYYTQDISLTKSDLSKLRFLADFLTGIADSMEQS